MKTIAEDRFERYFTEKLWEMIPAIYRHEDGIAENPGVLRAIVEVLAKQAAILRRSQDRLWEDQSIELCNDWAVPYIADLVGTRLVSAQNKRGRRVDVAKTIYYRRRKGTLRVLEELISDITGWDGKVVENFRRLGRARHGLDPHPAPLSGRFSGTMPGSWADLRRPLAAEVAGGPFDEFFHTPDVRRHRGQDGRYNIPKLAVHLYRLTAFPVENVTPFSLEEEEDKHRFAFDPSGRDIPLFNRRNRAEDWEEWRSALEWELPAPIRCRVLGHAEYLVNEAAVQKLAVDPGLGTNAAAALRKLRGSPFRDEARLRTTLLSLDEAELLIPAVYLALLRNTIIEACGKQALLPNAQAVSQQGQTSPDHGSLAVILPDPEAIVTAEYITSADLSRWRSPVDLDFSNFIDRVFGAQGIRSLAIDPQNGRFLLRSPIVEELSVSYHYGFSGPIGAGTYDRREVKDSEPDQPLWEGGGDMVSANLNNLGVTQIAVSKTYRINITKQAVRRITWQAANLKRPYLLLESDLILNTGAANANSLLVLDGLWMGAGQGPRYIYLRGNYECVEIRHCTLDPGGLSNCTLHRKDNPDKDILIQPIILVVDGFVENLCITNCITGPLQSSPTGMVETVYIKDSIVQSIDPDVPAIQLSSGMLNMERVTVFGKMEAYRLQASEIIVTETAVVTDTQTGCFRFSAAPGASRLPRPYESFLYQKDSNHWFTSRRFGHPGYGQLSGTAPEALRRGAENGSEMGAFSNLLNPVKLDGLKAKIEEYMPFGLIPIFINET